MSVVELIAVAWLAVVVAVALLAVVSSRVLRRPRVDDELHARSATVDAPADGRGRRVVR